MQKLFIFVARDAPIAVIIRKERKSKREHYEMVKWNMETNEFTEGQWLMNKQLFINGCSISPNGKLFGWIYNKYWEKGNDTFAGISSIPNFTADLFATRTCGRWFNVNFDSHSAPLADDFAFVQRSSVIIPISNETHRVPSGLQEPEFVWNGKTVKVDGYKLCVDGEVIYDTTNHVFMNCPAEYTIESEPEPKLRRSPRIPKPIIKRLTV